MIRSLLLAVLLLPTFAGAAERARIIVAKSSNLSAYANVVAGFSAEVNADVEELTLPESAARVEKAMAEIQRKKPALVLAVGPTAATAARRELSGIPVLFTMVPYYERYGLEAPNVTGIALTNDLSVELSTLAAVSPGSRRVGILHDPRYSKDTVTQARKVAESKGLSVVPLELESAANVGQVLDGAREEVDALLLIADKTVANAAVVRTVITFALDARLPLLALSASQVKEGAMLALSPSYTGIGQQAGRLANRVVYEKVDPGALAVAKPEVLELTVNLSTANKVGHGCDVALELLSLAARRGYAIKVEKGTGYFSGTEK